MVHMMWKGNASTMDTWRKIIDYWNRSSLEIRAGVSPSEIVEFEKKYDVVLPKDFREYIEAVDGSSDGYMDDALYRFWPLSEIKPVHEELDESGGVVYTDRHAYPGCFVFADYCINCWLYAVKLTKDAGQPAPVFRVTAGDTPGEQMAPSFLEFMKLYSNNPESIL